MAPHSKCHVITEEDTYAKLEAPIKITKQVKLRNQKDEFYNRGTKSIFKPKENKEHDHNTRQYVKTPH